MTFETQSQSQSTPSSTKRKREDRTHNDDRASKRTARRLSAQPVAQSAGQSAAQSGARSEQRTKLHANPVPTRQPNVAVPNPFTTPNANAAPMQNGKTTPSRPSGTASNIGRTTAPTAARPNNTGPTWQCPDKDFRPWQDVPRVWALLKNPIDKVPDNPEMLKKFLKDLSIKITNELITDVAMSRALQLVQAGSPGSASASGDSDALEHALGLHHQSKQLKIKPTPPPPPPQSAGAARTGRDTVQEDSETTPGTPAKENVPVPPPLGAHIPEQQLAGEETEEDAIIPVSRNETDVRDDEETDDDVLVQLPTARKESAQAAPPIQRGSKRVSRGRKHRRGAIIADDEVIEATHVPQSQRKPQQPTPHDDLRKSDISSHNVHRKPPTDDEETDDDVIVPVQQEDVQPAEENVLIILPERSVEIIDSEETDDDAIVPLADHEIVPDDDQIDDNIVQVGVPFSDDKVEDANDEADIDLEDEDYEHNGIVEAEVDGAGKGAETEAENENALPVWWKAAKNGNSTRKSAENSGKKRTFRGYISTIAKACMSEEWTKAKMLQNFENGEDALKRADFETTCRAISILEQARHMNCRQVIWPEDIFFQILQRRQVRWSKIVHHDERGLGDFTGCELCGRCVRANHVIFVGGFKYNAQHYWPSGTSMEVTSKRKRREGSCSVSVELNRGLEEDEGIEGIREPEEHEIFVDEQCLRKCLVFHKLNHMTREIADEVRKLLDAKVRKKAVKVPLDWSVDDERLVKGVEEILLDCIDEEDDDYVTRQVKTLCRLLDLGDGYFRKSEEDMAVIRKTESSPRAPGATPRRHFLENIYDMPVDLCENMHKDFVDGLVRDAARPGRLGG